jgi:hypothetical protein
MQLLMDITSGISLVAGGLTSIGILLVAPGTEKRQDIISGGSRDNTSGTRDWLAPGYH